jgi:ferrous iron transport protein B
MARAAFVMDRFMRWIGLPGKSFIPMMVGFGCTVPAIMGTRTLESKKDRFMTMFMSPFMSCGARLPVYALFAAAFFPAFAGGVVFSLYVIGIVLAVVTGLLLKRTLFRGDVSHFIMELPRTTSPGSGTYSVPRGTGCGSLLCAPVLRSRSS